MPTYKTYYHIPIPCIFALASTTIFHQKVEDTRFIFPIEELNELLVL